MVNTQKVPDVPGAPKVPDVNLDLWISPYAQDIVAWNCVDANFLLQIWELAKSLLKAISDIGISKNPESIKNIVECALLWHSDWLNQYLDDIIKENWELYVWLKFTGNHSHGALKEAVEDINKVVYHLELGEKQELYDYILAEFKVNNFFARKASVQW
jgi:arabinogalactan endo-1,4-beta-galactosidase